MASVNITAYRQARQNGGVWSTNMDFLSRKPFQYQPLCYADALAAHAAAGVPPTPAPAPGVAGPIVKVAALQMNSVGVAPGEDPVPAHMERASLFVREAKTQGADVVVFPEQWSVGYSRNYDKANYDALDSATRTQIQLSPRYHVREKNNSTEVNKGQRGEYRHAWRNQ